MKTQIISQTNMLNRPTWSIYFVLTFVCGCASSPLRFKVLDAASSQPLVGCSVTYWFSSGSIFYNDDSGPQFTFVGTTDSNGNITVPPQPQHNQYHFYFVEKEFWSAEANYDLGGNFVDVSSPNIDEFSSIGKIMPNSWLQRDFSSPANSVVLIRLRKKDPAETASLPNLKDWLREHYGAGTPGAKTESLPDPARK